MHKEAVGLRLTFLGYLGAEAGQESASAVANELAERAEHMTLEVASMTGYASDARRAWQGTLRPYRKRLLSLTLVGANPLVRMGATAMGLALGVRVRFLAADVPAMHSA